MPLPKISGVFSKKPQAAEDEGVPEAVPEAVPQALEDARGGSAEAEQPKKVSQDELSVFAESVIDEDEKNGDGGQAEDETVEHDDGGQETGGGASDELRPALEAEAESEPASSPEPAEGSVRPDSEGEPAPEPVKDEKSPGARPDESPGSLHDTLSEIFQKRNTRDPLVQALLDEHGDVDLQDLASDLKNLAGGLGS